MKKSTPSHSAQNPSRILIVRNDGLGDLILTLPLAASLKAQQPSAQISMLVSSGLAPLAALCPQVDEIIEDAGWLLKRHTPGKSKDQINQGQADLEEALRRGSFDAALLPYAESQSAALVHRAKIPLRAGPLRRSFFWRFNRFFTSSRKNTQGHEFDFNLGYLPLLGLKPSYAPPTLDLSGVVHPDGPEKPIVIHPYKRNATALSWPLEKFSLLAKALLKAGYPVVALGDKVDAPVLENFAKDLPGLALRTDLSLPQAAALLANARAFVGGSSGPLHLAALVGTPHVGLFPLARVSAPARWQTLPVEGAPENPGLYLLKSPRPHPCVRCSGEKCPRFNCMEDITLQAVLASLQAWGVKI